MNHESNVSERALLDQLLAESRLYRSSKRFGELMDFIARLRSFAPFNAMLLHIQKPGLSYAASAKDWRERFGRSVKEGARPLLIMWPFGPVALVYDIQDTEGPEPPRDVASFFARGPVTDRLIRICIARCCDRRIEIKLVDHGDASAGYIRVDRLPADDNGATSYVMALNQNHPPPTQFATIAHELAHLFLGHLGEDRKLHASERRHLKHEQRELEAEAVAYLVCARNGVQNASEKYLSAFVKHETVIEDLDLYQITRAAGQIEGLLGLNDHAPAGRTTNGPEALFGV